MLSLLLVTTVLRPPIIWNADVFRNLPGYHERHQGSAGRYWKAEASSQPTAMIAIESSQLTNPFGIVATIAHELGHVLLLGGRKLSGNESDHELLTDLVTIFFGLGIFTANAAFQFSQWQSDSKQGWSSSQQGYLSESMYGYVLACFAWMRPVKTA